MPRKRQPRGGHGGARTGAPGASYPNRSDLRQAPRAAPNQTYGEAGAQLAAQRAIPLPVQSSSSAAPVSGGGGGTAAQAPPPVPLDAASLRPNEPLTNGIAGGPGAGPEALTGLPMQPLDEIRAMYAADPNDDLRQLIAFIEGY